jgi:hypothetical protein
MVIDGLLHLVPDAVRVPLRDADSRDEKAGTQRFL